jgi:hypothetical protein
MLALSLAKREEREEESLEEEEEEEEEAQAECHVLFTLQPSVDSKLREEVEKEDRLCLYDDYRVKILNFPFKRYFFSAYSYLKPQAIPYVPILMLRRRTDVIDVHKIFAFDFETRGGCPLPSST